MTTEIKSRARRPVPPPAPPPRPGSVPRVPPVPGAVRPPSRELRPRLAAAGAGMLAALAWTLWQTTASRLSLFIAAATVAAAVIDVVWALVATRRVELSVTANPAEAVVGDTVAVTIEVTGVRQFVDLRVLTFGGTRGQGVDVPDKAVATGMASVREVLTEVFVEVEGRGLAGLVSCARTRVVPLRRPLHVGPRRVPAGEHFPELYRTWGEGQARPAPTGDLVRGVRPYVAGDPMRKVHWRATARDLSGDLVVKEVEETGAPRLHIVLDLGSGGAAAERAAGRAAWYAEEGLRRGYYVVLGTAELVRPHAGQPYRGQAVARTAQITSTSDIIRRLAAAGAPGKPDMPGLDEPGGVVVVTDQGDSWR